MGLFMQVLVVPLEIALASGSVSALCCIYAKPKQNK